MKALVYTGPEALDYRDAPDPAPRPKDALIAVAHVGVCGSDMHAWAGHDERRPAPLILGHEAAGTILEGPGAGGRVTVNPLVTCGACEDCLAGRENLCARRQIISMPPREGAFAERLSMPPGNLVAIPDNVPTEKAALAEPIACGWHAVRLARRALNRPLEEARSLVLGGGAIGLGAALVLAAEGAREIWLAETNPARRAIVAKAGDFRVFDPAEGVPEAVDLVIDGVGFAATRAAASAAARPAGDHLHRNLHLQRRRFPRHRRGDLRRPARRARLARDPPPLRRRSRVRRHQGGPRGGAQDHSETLKGDQDGKTPPPPRA
jgi:threonine dehydrogenase-like Zn-dependent dehydrogenase